MYSEFEIPYERLVDIGWAKLSVMARHVDRSSIEKWLSLAENNSVQSLKAKVKGCPPATRHFVFMLTDEQREKLKAVLVENGAHLLSDGRLIDKENAIMRMLQRT